MSLCVLPRGAVGVVAAGLLVSGAAAQAQTQIVMGEVTVSLDAQVDSNGVLGQTLFLDGTRIETSESGGNNISDGLFEFDLASLPDDAVVLSADFLVRTAGLSIDTSPPSVVTFTAFAGDGVLSLADQAAPGTLVLTEDLNLDAPLVFIANNTDLSFTLADVSVINEVLTDTVASDFLTLRTETESFVSLRVDALESLDLDAQPARLLLTYETAVPEPATAGLLALGCVAGLARRRRG